MRILVTGAAGFIGSHLCEALLKRGDEVTGIDNFDLYYNRLIKEKNLEPLKSFNNFRFKEGDLRDSTWTLNLLEDGFESVAHIAARGGVRASILYPDEYVGLNYVSTVNLLEAMKKTAVKKLLLASTSSVYGNTTPVPFKEDSPVNNPISPYAATKKACEVMAYTYNQLYGIDTYILRFFTVYGPRQRPDMAIHKFVKLIIDGKEIEMYGDGSTLRDYTYISDIISGVVKGIDGISGYEIINIGGHATTSLSRLIEIIESALNKKAKIKRVQIPAGDVLQTLADVNKAKRLLGYAPNVSLEDGIPRFVEWYLEKK